MAGHAPLFGPYCISGMILASKIRQETRISCISHQTGRMLLQQRQSDPGTRSSHGYLGCGNAISNSSVQRFSVKDNF